ncbi:MAG: mycothiol system anti-sigma-R factor [Propionibacteriaceae bacterium]|jgi:mycothiol system anti-sigma-R factor|nr:mycothiol system anti-sigma-R factor [Propionibacteriaceae bacterium]
MSDSEDCRYTLERIFAFHDGVLPQAEVDEVGAHLMGCEGCLDAYEVERVMRAVIKRGCNVEAPASLREKVRASLATA